MTQEVLFDQMKSVITKDGRLNGEKLVTNAEFVRFAAHWGFRVRACRPYRAKTKGKVERPISYVRDNFIYGREFLGDGDLDDQCRRWLDHTANVRLHRTIKEQPLLRFERDEWALLQPLPARPYRSIVFGRRPPSPENVLSLRRARFQRGAERSDAPSETSMPRRAETAKRARAEIVCYMT